VSGDSDYSAQSELGRLGWTAERQAQLEGLGRPDLVPARVSAQHRGAYGLTTAVGVTGGHLAGHFHQGDGTPWPAVGDWVAVQPSGELGIIQEILPRTSLLERLRPGSKVAQVIAANVDVVFVVTDPGADLSARRTERYLAAIWASGARPVLVLNKTDLGEDVAGALAALSAVAGGVTRLATSAATGAGLAELRAQLPAGATGALVGSSGVGKSSLLNRLLGEARLATAEVRVTDEKGRHTTTRRELVELPDGGGAIIDTPGMRELGLWDAGEGLEVTFGDIEALAARCHFRDCHHRGEPGCAVAEAIAQGAIDEARMASFEQLRREQAYLERQRDPRSAAVSKGRWKVIHKQHRARKKVDPKLRSD
jgi:ribosome biogenesis GTPase